MSKSLIYGVKHDYERLRNEYNGYVESAEKMRAAVIDAAGKTRLIEMGEKLDKIIDRAYSLPEGMEKESLIGKMQNLARQIMIASSVRP